MRFTLDGQDIVIRTDGSRLADVVSDTVVAYEADHIDPATETGWSVVAVGYARHAPASEVAPQLPLWTPGPHPQTVRIRAEVVTGRRLTDSP